MANKHKRRKNKSNALGALRNPARIRAGVKARRQGLVRAFVSFARSIWVGLGLAAERTQAFVRNSRSLAARQVGALLQNITVSLAQRWDQIRDWLREVLASAYQHWKKANLRPTLSVPEMTNKQIRESSMFYMTWLEFQRLFVPLLGPVGLVGVGVILTIAFFAP